MLESLQKTVGEFIIRIGTVITVLSATLFIANNFSFTAYLGEGGEDGSILAFFAKKTAFLFYPIGIKDWRFSAAIFTGIFAKEGIASSLSLLLPTGFSLSARQAIAVVAFCYLYTPCLTALSAIKARVGLKATVVSATFQFLVALAACYATYFALFFV